MTRPLRDKVKYYIKLVSFIGIPWMVYWGVRKFIPFRPLYFKKYEVYFKNKRGLEVGGPSSVFKKGGIFPIYPICDSLDNCNYKSDTAWEHVSEGNTFNFYKNKYGRQYILETTNLKKINSSKYDFIISSHVLEHTSNSILAVSEWKRVVKKKGILFVIVPDKRGTFDRNREITPFKHLLSDYKHHISEKDLTHVSEIIESYDLSMNLSVDNKSDLKKLSLTNYKNRCLHQHVFDEKLLRHIFDFLNIKIINTFSKKPYHIVIIGQKK